MKSWIKKLCCLSLLLSGSTICYLNAASDNSPSSNSSIDLKDDTDIDIDKLSKAMGHLLTKNFKNPAITFNIDQIIAGMKDEMGGVPSPMTEEECYEIISKVQERLLQKKAAQNLADAVQFLEANAKRDGIVAVEPKLQYLVLADAPKESTESVKENSSPLIHYQGKLLDGTEFGSSYEAEPIAIPMEKTIPGFSKGLLGMKEGEKRRLYIHPDLAYGTMGHLPPNSLLIFDVEVIKLDNSTAAEEDLEANSAHS